MKKGLTSIIMTCYDQTQTMRHISMLAAADIVRHTNREEYELIIVDCIPKYPFRDDYKVLDIDKIIEFKGKDPGYAGAMNAGAKEAKGEYLCFIENDMFVKENWLPNLRWYLENKVIDIVMPDQTPTSRKQYLSYQEMDHAQALGKGCAEQGMAMMSAETFKKFGGWDENVGIVFTWKKLYRDVSAAKLSIQNTAKTTVSHVTGVGYYYLVENDMDKYNKICAKECNYLNNLENEEKKA